MEVILLKFYTYHTDDTNNTINKNLKEQREYDVTLKNPENLITPSIVINHRESFKHNYAYIPDFNRYYFIRNVTRVNRDLVQLILEVDVLETFKEDILQAEGTISRHKSANKHYDGGDYPNEEVKDHNKYYSNTTPEFGETVLMTMIGG